MTLLFLLYFISSTPFVFVSMTHFFLDATRGVLSAVHVCSWFASFGCRLHTCHFIIQCKNSERSQVMDNLNGFNTVLFYFGHLVHDIELFLVIHTHKLAHRLLILPYNFTPAKRWPPFKNPKLSRVLSLLHLLQWTNNILCSPSPTCLHLIISCSF